MSLYLALPLLAFAVNSFLLLLVRLHGSPQRETAHTVFSLFLLCMALWGLSVFAMRSSPNLETAFLWEHLVLGILGAISVLYFHFVLLFTGVRLGTLNLVLLYGLLMPTLALLPLSNWVLESMIQRPYGYAPKTGILFPFWVVSLYVLIIMSLGYLITHYRRSRSPDHRNRVSYVIVGTFVSLLGATSDYVAALGFLPQPGGILGNIVFAVCCATAMVRYRLMGVRVVLRRAIGYSLASATAVLPFALIVYATSRFLNAQKISLTVTVVLLALVAIASQPLLTWSQSVVDRWFYRRRYNYLQALRRFSQEAKYITDLESLVGSLVNLLSLAMQTNRVAVLAHFLEGYVVVGASSLKEDNLPRIPDTGALAHWLSEHEALVTREELGLIPQLQALTQGELKVLEAAETEILVPMKIERELVGLILLGPTRSGRPYATEDLDLLWTVANQAALGLESARLLAVERERSETLRRVSEMRGEFLLTVAHELKTPVTVIKAALGMLEEIEASGDGTGEAPRQLVSSARRSASSLEKLITDLMTFAKAKHQTLQVERQSVNPNDLVRDAIHLIDPLIRDRQQKLELSLQPQCPIIELDPALFGRIINNLLSNAYKYTPQGGKIGVKLVLENTQLVLTVSDNGIGIPAEELPWLFEPYHRASSAVDSSIPGSGLGLAISKALVELMGGSINVESTVGVGTRFTVILPVEVSRESVSN